MSFSILYFPSKTLPPDSCVIKKKLSLEISWSLKTRPTLPQFWKDQILSILYTRASALSAKRAQVCMQLGVAVVDILELQCFGVVILLHTSKF